MPAPAVGLLLLYLVAVPLVDVVVPTWTAHDMARVAQMLLWAAVVPLGWRRMVGCLRRATRLGLAVGCAGLFAAGLAVWHAPVKPQAVEEAGLLAGMVLLAVALAGENFARLSRQLAWAVLIAMGLQQGLQMLLAVASMSAGIPLHVDQLASGYLNHRFFNHVQTVALPLMLVAGQALPDRVWAQRLMRFNLATGGALLVLYVARASLLALLVALVLTMLVDRRQSSSLLKDAIRTIVHAALVYGLVFGLLPAVLHVEFMYRANVASAGALSDHERLYLWARALDFFQTSAWWGIGPMHFAHHPHPEAAHPHNFALQLLAEWGAPFAALVLWLSMVLLFRVAIRLRGAGAETGTRLPNALWLACVAASVDALFSGNMVMPVSQVWVAMTAGWLACWYRSAGGVQRAGAASCDGRRWVVTCLASVLSMTCLSCVALACSDAFRLADLLSTSAALTQDQRLNPRFWSSGWF